MEETYSFALERFKNTRKRWLNLCTKEQEVQPTVERLLMQASKQSAWEGEGIVLTAGQEEGGDPTWFVTLLLVAGQLVRSLKSMGKRQKMLEKRQVRVERALGNVNDQADALLRVLEKISGCQIKQMG